MRQRRVAVRETSIWLWEMRSASHTDIPCKNECGAQCDAYRETDRQGWLKNEMDWWVDKSITTRRERERERVEWDTSFFSTRQRQKECTGENETRSNIFLFLVLRVCAYKQCHWHYVRIYVNIIVSMSGQCVRLSCKEAPLWWYYNPSVWHKLSVEEGLNQVFSLSVIICAFHVQATHYSHRLLKLWRIIQACGRQKHFAFRLKKKGGGWKAGTL